MPQASHSAAGTPEIAIFAQGPIYCAVCASRGATQETIEAEVARRNDGLSGWRAVKGPLLDGRHNPRCCPHDARRQHWLIVRSND